MPKVKTKKTLAKRIRVTAKGKLLRRHIGTSHLKVKQSSKTKRRKRKEEIVAKSQRGRIKKLLPYSK